MPYLESSRFCRHCNKQVLVRKNTYPGFLWVIALFSIFMLPILVIGSLLNPWRCSFCGRSV